VNKLNARVLLIESDDDFAELARGFLAEGGYFWDFGSERVARLDKALPALRRGDWDVALLDLDLPDCKGLDALERALAARPGLPIVAMVSLGQEPLGAEALRRGAQEYLVKGTLDARLLRRTLRYAIEKAGLLARLDLLSRQIRQLSVG
jgi:two-component system, cell cycle response regulator